MTDLLLHVVSETPSRITLGWEPVPGAVGYRFQSQVQAPKWSHTWDPSRNQVTFGKADWYKVQALGLAAEGTYPTPAPPAHDYTYRFATFNPSTDKVTGTVNRYNGPYANNWWVPGQPAGYTWPNGGGINEITTPWGPGLELVCTKDMIYPGVDDTRLCRFVGDPTDTGKFPDGSWCVRGKPLEFNWTLLWPAAGNTGGWIDALVEGWLLAAKSAAGPNAVFHHLYLRRQPDGNLTYYLGRSDFQASNGQSWTRYPSGLTFPPDTPHHLKVELLLDTNGYIRAYTNTGQGFVKFADYQGNTYPIDWGPVYTQYMDIRPPLGGTTNTLQWINHRVTVQ